MSYELHVRVSLIRCACVCGLAIPLRRAASLRKLISGKVKPRSITLEFTPYEAQKRGCDPVEMVR